MTVRAVLNAIMMIIFVGLCGLVVWRWQVNGWGSVIWLGSAIVMMVIRSPHATKNKQNKISEQFAVSTERVLLGLVSLGGTVIPMLHLAFGIFRFADYSAPIWLPVIGVALLLPGLHLFWRSHADLGRNWSVTTEIREDHTLITDGIYARIRHPMYSAIWLIFFAYPFLIQNWIAGTTGLISFAILYFVRVPIEEGMMRQQFGATYDDYVGRTGRLWPRLGQ